MFDTVQETFAQNKAAFEHQQRERNQAIDDLRERFKQGDPAAVEEHIDIVFQNSTYPDEIPRNWDRELRPDAGMLILNLQLPAPEDLPAVESYSYVKSRDEIKSKSLSDANKARLYDDFIYKVILRTLHEIFESDAPGV